MKRALPWLLLAGCRSEAPPQPPVEKGEAAAAAPDPAANLEDLLGGMVLVPPGSRMLELENLDEICERDGYPDELAAASAAELGDVRPGSSVVIVHPQGQTTVKVASAGCRKPETYTPAATVLILDAPAGPAWPDERDVLPPPYLAFTGVTPHADARLAAPVAYDWRPPAGRRTREVLSGFAQLQARARLQLCEKTGEGAAALREPTAAMIDEAVKRASVSWIEAADENVVFAVIEDPAITFGCYEGQDPSIVAALVDLEAGVELVSFDCNNTLEPQWVVDLDGDGVQEILVDITWLEDGGHAIKLVRRTSAGWGEVSLWAADGP